MFFFKPFIFLIIVKIKFIVIASSSKYGYIIFWSIEFSIIPRYRQNTFTAFLAHQKMAQH